MNLKTSGLAPAFVFALLPLAAGAQTAPASPNSAQPRLQTTFTSPLKMVGSDGFFTVTPRNSTTVWSCAEGQSTQIRVGNPTLVAYTLSPDGSVITALANGGSFKVDVAKSQFATAAYGDPIDSAPMKDFATIGSAAVLFGTSPTAVSTGFELLYSAAYGLHVAVKTGERTLGVFTVAASKWQLGFFPLDDTQAAADATGATPPPVRGDVTIIGGACKGSPVPDTSVAK